MNLQNLKKTKNKNRKRVGRGISAGQGKTAGRGTKGQGSRSGGGVRPGFEGGQMPLSQRVPKKKGFRSRSSKPTTVNITKLSAFKNGEIVNLESLKKVKIIASNVGSVKIVGNGEVKAQLKIEVPMSKKAAEIVKKTGGSVK